MGRGPQLTSEEQATIVSLFRVFGSVKAVAKEIDRSANVVRAFLRDPEGYGTRKSSGRRAVVTAPAKRMLIRSASQSGKSAAQLIFDLQLDISKRHAQRLLSQAPDLQYTKRKHAPVLTAAHKQRRVTFATLNHNRDDIWNKTIFTDEKKFNLDGPDCMQYYWHDLRREAETYKTRQSGGGSVMIWGGFSAKGKTQLAFLEGNQNSDRYCNTIRDYLLPFARAVHENDYIFQQDNASIHASRLTRETLTELGVTTMDWPSKSPDLNPIENVWGVLARAVYANGRQYDNREELKASILAEWERLPMNYLLKLIQSMNRRCAAVLTLNGAKTKY